ncbi:MAG: hypothetical protein RJB38_1463 [Pseudomonadota bacterium]
MFSKKLLVAAAMLVAAVSPEAHARGVRFTFKTFSSGPSIYACNAGIRSPGQYKSVCYFEGTTDVCSSGQTRCTCSGGVADFVGNFIEVTHQDWKDNGASTATNVTRVATASRGAWNMAVADSTAWGKTIKELTFNLGSELYGAQYFVDICYRGPQIEYFEEGINAAFALRAQTSTTDFSAWGANPGDNSTAGLSIPGTVDGKKYSELAGLKVQSFVVCDQQGLGTYQYARNNSGHYNYASTSAAFKYGTDGLPSGANEAADLFASSTAAAVTASAMDIFGGTAGTYYLNSGNSYAPRFCKVRYVFSETNAFQTTGVNIRKWQRHGAQITTWTGIDQL